LANKIDRRLDVLCEGEDLVVVHGLEAADVGHDSAGVGGGLDDVASASFALGADEGSTLRDAAESFPEVAAAAQNGDGEWVFVDVVAVVGGGEDLGLVEEVSTGGLEDLSFDEVANAGLGHDGDGDGALDALY